MEKNFIYKPNFKDAKINNKFIQTIIMLKTIIKE